MNRLPQPFKPGCLVRFLPTCPAYKDFRTGVVVRIDQPIGEFMREQAEARGIPLEECKYPDHCLPIIRPRSGPLIDAGGGLHAVSDLLLALPAEDLEVISGPEAMSTN